jgi:hypothetical protein
MPRTAAAPLCFKRIEPNVTRGLVAPAKRGAMARMRGSLLVITAPAGLRR